MAPIWTPHGENKLKILKREQVLWTLMYKLSSRCASFVGCRGGVQPIYLSDSCSAGNLCHEIIHALGLHHEHTRVDRDRYITVQWENILPGRASTINACSPHNGNLHWRVCNILLFLVLKVTKRTSRWRGATLWTFHMTSAPSCTTDSESWRTLALSNVWFTVYGDKKQNKCRCFVAGTFLVMMDVRRCWPSRGGRRWVRGHTSPSWICRNWTDSTTVVPHRLCFSIQWFLLQFLYLWMWCLQK